MTTLRVDVDQFLSAIREIESGGNYSKVGPRVRGQRPVGAYQILEDHWPMWARAAGIPGASWREPLAQERVAQYRARRYLSMFGGNHELAAAAWIGGTDSARKIMQAGGTKSVRNQEIAKYLGQYRTAINTASRQSKKMQKAPQSYEKQIGSGGWVMPVAGPSEYSGGSWMPTTETHRGRTHAAIDVYASTGTPIVAPVSGKVTQTTTSKIGGYMARIKGDDGITYYFAHMNEAAVVGAGQRVLAGTHIGYVGNSGSAAKTKPHLHFSMRKSSGETINPYGYLKSAEEGVGVPVGELYSKRSPVPQSQNTRWANMLEQMSNQVAGGQRDPNILLDPAPADGGDVLSNQEAAVDEAPDFLVGKDTYENPEVP